MRDAWPTPSPQVKDLIRRAATLISDPAPEWVDQLHAAALGGIRMKAVADDPVLAEGTRRTNLANALRWARHNIAHPGERVPAAITPEILSAVRDLVRRGLGESALDAFRTVQAVAWRRWMDICFTLTDDPRVLREVFDVTSLSISTFIEDTVAAMSERMQSERDELTRGTHALRREALTLLLEGAPIPIARAEGQLGYSLTGVHTALVLWTDEPEAAATLEAEAEAVAASAGCETRLTISASAVSMWMWLPVDGADIPAHTPAPSVRVAIGRGGTGVGGFRSSHFQALTTQRALSQLGGEHRIARFDDVRLVSLITAAGDDSDDFVTDTLGELATADTGLVDTVRTWIMLHCNTSRTADKLYTHRNTVIRRLARADELLPRPLAENILDVGVALEVLHWRR
ncbi:MAG: helix-turn-helix domain-containing protein [Gordonia sp. (in: high G+C Gram-positive bacteria)]